MSGVMSALAAKHRRRANAFAWQALLLAVAAVSVGAGGGWVLSLAPGRSALAAAVIIVPAVLFGVGAIFVIVVAVPAQLEAAQRHRRLARSLARASHLHDVYRDRTIRIHQKFGDRHG